MTKTQANWWQMTGLVPRNTDFLKIVDGSWLERRQARWTCVGERLLCSARRETPLLEGLPFNVRVDGELDTVPSRRRESLSCWASLLDRQLPSTAVYDLPLVSQQLFWSAFFVYIYNWYFRMCSLYNLFIYSRFVQILSLLFWPWRKRSSDLLLVSQQLFWSAFFVYIYIYYFRMCYNFYSIVDIPRWSRDSSLY